MSLRDSSISNFFLKAKSVMDSIVKFAVKARTNSLRKSNSLPSKRGRSSGAGNNCLCKLCGAIETLHHIINGCPRSNHLYTSRHDAVQNVLLKHLTEVKRLNVHSNQTVRGRSSERLNGDSANLKPDLWWWEGDRLMLAEFTIPYGMLTDKNGETESTLTSRRREKLEKYSNLRDDCASQFGCDTTLLTLPMMQVTTSILT